MSKLNEVIHKLRPDELEYISIGSLITRIREKGNDDPDVRQVYVVSNTQGMVKAEEYRENTIHSEDTSNYTIVRENMIAYNPSRLNIGSIARLKYSEAGLVSPMYVVFSINSQKIMYEYFDHIIKSSYVASKINSLKEEGARFRFEFSRWDRIIIPVPPLPVQEEIVRILDKFTQLTAELITELTERKKQYEYYRDSLYAANDTDVEWTTLDRISENCDRQRKPVTKGNRVAGKYPYYGASGIVDYVEDYIFDGDFLLVSEDGANLLARSTPIAFSISGKNWVNNHAHVLKFDTYELRRYVEIYLNSIDLSKYISGGAQPKLNQENLNKIPIPVPSPERVKYVVSILDRFDTLCHDISEGLPAEIEARQKQYEYYRDKLLTFEECKENVG